MYFISFRIACQRPPLDCCVTIMSVRTYFMSHFSRAFHIRAFPGAGDVVPAWTRVQRPWPPGGGSGALCGARSGSARFPSPRGQGAAQQAESRAGQVPPGRRAPDLPPHAGWPDFSFPCPLGNYPVPRLFSSEPQPFQRPKSTWTLRILL